MESVVNKIIEIDRMADLKISDAHKESDRILREAEQQCGMIKRNISAEAQKRIAEIENINKSDFDSRVAALEEKYAAEKKEMDAFFESSHKSIEDSIFAEIVGE